MDGAFNTASFVGKGPRREKFALDKTELNLNSDKKIGKHLQTSLSPKGESVSPNRDQLDRADINRSAKLINAHKDSEYAKYLMKHTNPAINQVLQKFEATSEVGRKR